MGKHGKLVHVVCVTIDYVLQAREEDNEASQGRQHGLGSSSFALTRRRGLNGSFGSTIGGN